MNDGIRLTGNSIEFLEKNLNLCIVKFSFAQKSFIVSEKLFSLLEIANYSWKSIFLQFDRSVKRTLLQAIKQVYQERTEINFIIKITTQQGNEKTLQVFLRSCAEDAYQSVEGIVQDISREVYLESSKTLALENSLRQNLHKSIFLGNTSHDLRTPLNTIIGYSDLLMEEWETSEPEQVRKDLQTIRNSGKNLLELINVIIDWANIEAERFTREEEVFSLKELLDDVQEHVQPSLETKNNTLMIENTFPNHKINSDPEKLHACLSNLLFTANKFNKNAEIQLKISSKEQGAGEIIRCIVEDNGIGIEQIDSKNLFIPSIHRDDKGSRRYGSSGLTLTLTAKLVELLGGKVLPPKVSEANIQCIFEIPNLTVPSHQ
ncbi:MAG: HAMP domain-containing sensor histidine kinase [Spirochaetota bacterium]